MKTKQQVEREFREALQRLVDEYSAELEAMDHWEGHPECGQDVRMTCRGALPIFRSRPSRATTAS